MIKLLSTLLLLFSILHAETTITLQKGWQFIGFPTDIKDLASFDTPEVDIIWGYDGTSQNWMGYSPNKEKQAKINTQYKKLTSIASWQGIWIHNNKSWSLTLTDDQSKKNTITLTKGWNLISLPSDITVSPSLFQDDILWKYHDKKWQFSSQKDKSKDIAPPISKIDAAEALWVKSNHNHQISLSQDSSTLHTFTSKEKMQQYIKEMALASFIPHYYDYRALPENKDGAILVDTPQAVNGNITADQKVTDTTGTNLQEEDVDESDILKHNTEHIFFYDRAQNSIHITSYLTLSQGKKNPINSIPLPKNTFLDAMFIKENKLIMIANQNHYYSDKMAIVPFAPQDNSDYTFDIYLYDISDINNIEELSKTTIDGRFQNSRIVENKLYIISQFSPRLDIEYPRIYIEDTKCQEMIVPMLTVEDGRYVPECAHSDYDKSGYYRYDYTNPTIKRAYLIPTINNGEKDLISHETFYAPSKLNQFPTITTISKFDITNNRFEHSLSLAGNTNKLYASSKNIYLTSMQYPYYYNFKDFQERETIYKFSLGDDFNYQAKGSIEGIMLNQFSMSEKDDILRVASTSGQGWRGDTNNYIFTLRQEDNTLQVEGKLSGLGHKGERIRGVRFLGDKGYLVTFQQKDPFYTLDLSNPSQPRQVGELNVTGFSSYIHPIDENFVLTLGRDATADGRQTGFKVSLYDISDFSHPKKSDEKIYSAALGGFDAEYNHQAFIYRKSDKLFGITYHDKDISIMDVLQVNSGKIDDIDRISTISNFNVNRGLIFNVQSKIFSTLFTTDIAISKNIGDRQ